MAGTKIVNANTKLDHTSVKGSAFIPVGEAGTNDSMAISVYELQLYINNNSGYVFNQVTPASTWIINHNLNTFPNIVVVDTGGNVVYGAITHTNSNSSTINFSAGFSGVAYCTK